jgi:hypothetical protein
MVGSGRDARQLVALAAALALAALAALIPATAHAISSPTPWDGVNPFNCTIQNAGRGTKVPDPAADPYCVEFDKTNQNITQLGIVQFLSEEPARTAAAVPKCFYFQEDHWRGSVVQSNGQTVIYEFYGHYFFNKATGDGGVWVTGFSVAGKTFDPTQLPGFPTGYGNDFGPGTGGFITHDDVPADPSCVALANKNPAAIYAANAEQPHCTAGTGQVERHGLGPLTLGMTEGQVRAVLGPPGSIKRGFLSYCVTGGGSLLVGQPGDRSGTDGTAGEAKSVVLLTTGKGFALGGSRLHVGSTTKTLKRALPRASKIGVANGVAVYRSGDLIAGVRHGHVQYLAAYETSAVKTKSVLVGYLKRAGAA